MRWKTADLNVETGRKVGLGKMAKRKILRHKSNLPETPAQELSEIELVAYRDLLDQIRRAGVERHASVEILCVAAIQKAQLELFNADIAKMESLVTHGANGQFMLHPYVKERRTLQNTYLGTLGKLLLTPRSKSTARVKEDDNTGFEAGEDPILKLCQ